MAYNRFKLKDLEGKLQLNVEKSMWLPTTLYYQTPDDFLLRQLSEAAKEALNSEKARSEFVIAPTLQALRRLNPNLFSIFSGYEFNVDKSLDLNGFCDFIFSLVPYKLTIESPVFCVVEAKKNDIDENAIAQCGAEMYAAQLFNVKENHPQKIIYGCVTTAFSWAFLKLEGKNLYIDPNYVPLTFSEPQRVLAVLQWILDCSLAN
jgi:hypothetical protein